MDCKITSIKKAAKRASALTLIEMTIAMPIVALVGLVAGQFTISGARTLQATANYLQMENDSRIALDIISRDIRQAQEILSFNPQRLVLLDADGTQLELRYDAGAKSLSRIKSGGQKLLLEGCDYLQFSIFQRTPIPEAYQFYPSSSTTTAKLVQIHWVCSRPVPGNPQNSEFVQNAAVVIRKKRGA